MEANPGNAVLWEARDGIVTLTLNRPGKRNPVSEPEMVDALVRCLERLGADRSVKVAILTGAGSAFSSGGDIRAMQALLEQRRTEPSRTLAYYKEGIQRIPLAFERLEVPIIAAVNGAAIGAGCDLACMCDIRIAADGARFAESFVRLGIVPGDGGAWLLPRVVGFSKACEMAFTGDSLTAAEALACGLVSRVVPDASLLDAAGELAKRIAANPTQAVRMTKRLIYEGRQSSLASILELSAAAQALAHATADHAEALDAALSKRPPCFTGD